MIIAELWTTHYEYSCLNGNGATTIGNMETLGRKQCKNACLNEQTCTGVTWTFQTCWLIRDIVLQSCETGTSYDTIILNRPVTPTGRMSSNIIYVGSASLKLSC